MSAMELTAQPETAGQFRAGVLELHVQTHTQEYRCKRATTDVGPICVHFDALFDVNVALYVFPHTCSSQRNLAND